MYSLSRSSYSGLSHPRETFEESSDARRAVARKLRSIRKRYKVTTLERGRQWEILEPEDCALVPDACGTLTISHVTFPCAECGHECETASDARECCAVSLFDE